MRKILTTVFIAVSAIGAASAAPVEAPKQSFKQDGYTYVYSVTTNAKGGETITGVRYPDQTPFTLTVKGNQVIGTSNDEPVTFSVAEAKGAAKGSVSE